jgi:hypothetical protein
MPRPSFLPLVTGELACMGSTGMAPITHFADGQFFEKAGYKSRKFANGWTLKSFEVAGGQHDQYYNAASVVYFRG